MGNVKKHFAEKRNDLYARLRLVFRIGQGIGWLLGRYPWLGVKTMIRTFFLRGTFVVVFLLLISLHPTSAFCEIQTITHAVKQPFGGSQSPDDARIAAIAKAKREALKRSGI